MQYYTSDECSNSKFLSLMLRVRRKVHLEHGIISMRSFLNALHESNLVLQSKTQVFQLITGKVIKDDKQLRAELLRLVRDPAWFLQYGPAGDPPLHVIFLLSKKELGREMLEALENLDAEMQAAYWDQCRRLRAKFPNRVEDIPTELSSQALITLGQLLPQRAGLVLARCLHACRGRVRQQPSHAHDAHCLTLAGRVRPRLLPDSQHGPVQDLPQRLLLSVRDRAAAA
jgi:hypothetical protein